MSAILTILNTIPTILMGGIFSLKRNNANIVIMILLLVSHNKFMIARVSNCSDFSKISGPDAYRIQGRIIQYAFNPKETYLTIGNAITSNIANPKPYDRDVQLKSIYLSAFLFCRFYERVYAEALWKEPLFVS